MSIIRDTASAAKTLAAISARDVSVALKTVTVVKMRDADNVLQTIGGGSFGYSATAAPTLVVGSGYSGSSIQVTTPYATVTVAGGVAPFTYSWTPVDMDWEAVSPDSAVTPFRSPMIPPGDTVETTFTCTVTDNNGASTVTNPVTARARNLG